MTDPHIERALHMFERMSRERTTGWVRVGRRGENVERNRAGFRKESWWDHAENRGRVQHYAAATNWRDHKDISSFYFTRFADDITERELWQHFKRWVDVREIFIPSRRNYNGRRYGFVWFKGVRDIRHLARQLDRIVIGGMKLYVTIPKYKRERRTQEATGRQSQSKGEGIQTRTHRVTQDH